MKRMLAGDPVSPNLCGVGRLGAAAAAASRVGLLALFLVLACHGGEPPGPQARPAGVPAEWLACERSSECAWVLGEGGWPTAVRSDAEQAYLDWVRSQAPFTTYFMPGDCFAPGELADYAARSRQAVGCVDERCAVALEPVCTR